MSCRRAFLVASALVCALLSRVDAASLPELVSFEPDGSPIDTYVEHAIASPNGRYVLSQVNSSASFSDRNCYRWYLRDLKLNATEIISRKQNGESVICEHEVLRGSAADMDTAGRYVVFDQFGGGIVPDALPRGLRVYLRDRIAGTIRLFGPPPKQRASQPSMDDAGTRVAMLVSEPNPLVVYDIASGKRVATAPASSASRPILSGDGRHVVFVGLSAQFGGASIAQIFLFDIESGEIELISAAPNGTPGDDYSINPTLNFDGSVVAFETSADNLVPAVGARLLIRDVTAGTTQPVLDDSGLPIQGGTPSLSADGNRLVFQGYAPSSLVFPEQAYLWETSSRALTLLSRNAAGVPADQGLVSFRCDMIGPCVAVDYTDRNPTISGDGRVVAFVSRGPNLVSNDFNGNGIDVYAVRLGRGGGPLAAVPIGGATSGILALLVLLAAAVVHHIRPGDL